MSHHADLLADLYKARLAKKEAMKAYDGGTCPFLKGFGPDYKSMPCKNDPPCTRHWIDDSEGDGFMADFNLREDCPDSIAILANMKTYHQAANKAGAALRACLKEGKYIYERGGC